ncbi:MAG TPA: hypothetical protein VD928_00575 [Candidatus Paceibacterota bacterium]|nr:hypothetical protein [Candidatus Paceibacterota bacterium]
MDPNLQSFTVANLWFQIVDFIPEVLTALAVIIVGWIIAVGVGALVKRVVRFTGVDDMVATSRLNERLNLAPESRYRLLSSFVGSVVKFLIILLALAMASDILGLTQITQFLGQIIGYIPQVIVAVVILTVGVLLSRFVSDLILAGFSAVQMSPSTERFIATIARYAIIMFSVMAALTQLGIVPRLIEIAFAGIIFALALAFGLGGQESAREWLKSLRQQQPQG